MKEGLETHTLQLCINLEQHDMDRKGLQASWPSIRVHRVGRSRTHHGEDGAEP